MAYRNNRNNRNNNRNPEATHDNKYLVISFSHAGEHSAFAKVDKDSDEEIDAALTEAVQVLKDDMLANVKIWAPGLGKTSLRSGGLRQAWERKVVSVETYAKLSLMAGGMTEKQALKGVKVEVEGILKEAAKDAALDAALGGEAPLPETPEEDPLAETLVGMGFTARQTTIGTMFKRRAVSIARAKKGSKRGDWHRVLGQGKYTHLGDDDALLEKLNPTEEQAF